MAELGYGPPGVNHMDFTSRKTHFSLLPYQIKSDITGHSTVPVADGGLPGEESDGNLHDAPHWVPHDDPGTHAPLGRLLASPIIRASPLPGPATVRLRTTSPQTSQDPRFS